jgi:hypothetical protein
MKKHTIKFFLPGILAVLLFMAGCSNTQSLQEYYVDNSENPNFLAIDVPASILNLDEADMSDTQREALQSLRKLNILAFKKTNENAAEYVTESAKVKEILKGSDYKDLMKLNSKFAKGVIKYMGEGDAIDEVVIYGDRQESGFALIRVLGDDMNPAHIMQLMQAVEKADMEGEGFQELANMLKG